ncbi:MAG: type I DNA topoisomerase [Candidatus Omnitrophica bacterium]|nr:type I DNA topoisomerase [Candidatus Omnitrophota bacterium]
MSDYLVIVESPTKVKTISKILGPEYVVLSSMGHVIDLPPKSLAVDVEDSFNPRYKVIPGKNKVLSLLKAQAKGKKTIYVATDPDREGEAIGWHIRNELKKDAKRFLRVNFHEITPEAVKDAFTHPRDFDMNLIYAQTARRVLDRIVGYLLSPLLWKKIVRGLSAGRVQSVALKFIVEREEAINAFVPKTTYGVEALLLKGTTEFTGRLVKFRKEKPPFEEKSHAEEAIAYARGEKFIVDKIEKKESKRKPPPPFITSSLQQEAFYTYRFSSQKTMLLAQKLYEGIEIDNQMVGLITYMRTDSYNVADRAKKEVKGYIESNHGSEYLPAKDYVYKAKKRAQEAHEAIRPTTVARTPNSLRDYLTGDLFKLYELIWRRFVSSFMAETVYESTKVTMSVGEAQFASDGRRIVFDGFQKIWEREEEQPLPEFTEGEGVQLKKMDFIEHTTKPPPHFNDASLVKLLEEKGIGRPSTYAPTIATLIRRDYVSREKGHFEPTELGSKVCKLLLENFPDIMDDRFTAQMEDKLDEVEAGGIEWNRILKDFYPSFKEAVDEATKKVQKDVEYTQEICPQCGKPLVVKWSRRGRFLSCAGYPGCKFAKSITTGIECPGCHDGELIERRNRRGQRFYGCTAYPKCTYTSRTLPDQNNTEEQ